MAEVPDTLDESNFFHSRVLMDISRHTPRLKPYMVVCTEESHGEVVSHMLATVRYRASILPPYFFLHCNVVGEGVYAGKQLKNDELFGEMLRALVNYLGNKVLYVEVSQLSHKMFGYRQFRNADFFPVHWMSIHNSLHSRSPEERISPRMQQYIDNALARGVECKTVETEAELNAFYSLLKRHNWLKPKRYIPHRDFFKNLKDSDRCQLFITKYHDRVIGCSACTYTEENAYLWYTAFRRKTYLPLHPDAITIWHAIKYAHNQGYQHINFMDVGLPFHKNPFREFILRFGGKPVSTYRWFRCSIGWINALLKWIYRE